MKQIIPILIVFLTAQLYPQQTDSTWQVHLGEVVVEGSRSTLAKTSSIITVTNEKMKQYDSYTVTEALTHQPGLYLNTTSKNESKIYLRGFNQRQIAIFLDGAPIYNPYEGFIDLSHMPLMGIEKVKISKSMPSLLYGPNAMAGTLNFITDNPKKSFDANLLLQGGDHQRLGFSTSGTYKNYFWYVGGNYGNSDGFTLSDDFAGAPNEDGSVRDNSQYESMMGHVKIGFRNVYNTDVALSVMRIDDEKGVPPDMYSDFPRYWRYSDWEKTLTNVMFRTLVSDYLQVKGNVFYDSYKNVLDSYDDKTYATQTRGYAFHSTYDDYSYGANVAATFYSDLLQQTNIALLYKSDTHKEQGNYNDVFKEYETESITFALEEEYSFISSLHTLAGISYDVLNPVNANGGDLRESTETLNGHLGVQYILNDQFQFHGNVSSKSRFPTMKEFYYETAGRNVANPELSVERGVNAEIGVSYMPMPEIILSVNGFMSNIDDLINLYFMEGGLRQFRNIDKAELLGVELISEISLSDLHIGFNYTYLSAKNTSESAESDHLEYRPEHMVNIRALYNLPYETSILSEMQFAGGKYGVNSNTRLLERMSDYSVFNVRLQKNMFSHFSLYVRVNNIFDRYYESEYGFPTPGREILFGVQAGM